MFDVQSVILLNYPISLRSLFFYNTFLNNFPLLLRRKKKKKSQSSVFMSFHEYFSFTLLADRMKINDLKMATPIEEKIDQNLKVSSLG
jgi:hypothetical protein